MSMSDTRVLQSELAPALRILIAHERTEVRARLRGFLTEEQDIAVVAECATGVEAVQAIRDATPDVVFLNDAMPEIDGFEVVRQAGARPMPVVIIVTDHHRNAVRAFQESAADYLLQPIEQKRFQRALDRARQVVQRRAVERSLADTLAKLDELHQAPQPVQRLAVKVDRRISVIRTGDVDWIRGARNYLQLHVGEGVHSLRLTLKEAEQQLPPDQFVRISRSIIVNIDRIQEHRAKSHGDAVIILRDGTALPASRTYRRALQAFMKRRQ